jgi:conjugal transfer pilus assembly protein TraB
MAAEGLEKIKQQWSDMDPKFKAAIGAIVIGGGIMVYVKGQEHDRLVAEQEATAKARAEAAAMAASNNPASGGLTLKAMPTTVRNQGLEDLISELDKTREDAKQSKEAAVSAAALVQKMDERMRQLENGKVGGTGNAVGTFGTSGAASPAAGPGSFSDGLPPPVSFAQPGGDARPPAAGTPAAMTSANPAQVDFGGAPTEGYPAARPQAKTKMHTWADESAPAANKKTAPKPPALTMPQSSALEAVMLTGINARSNSSGNAAAGTILSANNVGSPFVTRVKGNAILPNGWRVSNFSDCFISGNGIAVLSAERANVISNAITCVDKKGRIFESAIKAYGVDLDGIQGLSGRVVTKQGSLLAKTALAGVASGLGTALTPQGIPGYNSNQGSGTTQGVLYPNLNLVGQTALGSGVAEGAKALSKFYLDYAKEMFPVVEVKAGTRVTWILQETVELSQPSDKP